MRECAVFASLVEFEIPYNTRQQDDRRLHEEVALLLDPGFVQVEHYGIGGFVCVGYVRHEGRGNGIAAVATLGVVEVYNIESGTLGVLLPVFQEVVIDNGTEVGKFEM